MRTLTSKRLILGVLVVAILNLGIGFFVGYQRGLQSSDEPKFWDHTEITPQPPFEVFIPYNEEKPRVPNGAWGPRERKIYLHDVSWEPDDMEDELGPYMEVTFALGRGGDTLLDEESGTYRYHYFEPEEVRTFHWHFWGKPEIIDLWGRRFQIVEVVQDQSYLFGDWGRKYFVLLREIR